MAFDPSQYPFSTIVRITDTLNGVGRQASGVLIAPDEVLTAAHVVWDSGTGNIASNIAVVPALDGNSRPFGSATGLLSHFFPISDANGLESATDTEMDFAVIHLNRTVGNATGTMGLEADFPGGIVNISGYPANLGGSTMSDITTTVSLDAPFSDFVSAPNTISPGDSGGPVWISQPDGPYVVGISSTNGPSGSFFGQITAAILTTIEGWITQDVGSSSTTAPPPASPGTIHFDLTWTIVADGDFNGDRKTDIVFRRSSDSLVEIQFMNGASPAGGGPIGDSPFGADWSIAAKGDFNGDGKTDLVWISQSLGITEIQFLVGTTAMGGGVIANNPFGAGWTILSSGDFNGDGKADLLYQRGSDGLIEIQFVNGLDAAGGGVIANNPFDANWSVVARGDFNGDGKADLALQRQSDGLVELMYLNGLNNGGGGVIANNPFGTGWNIFGAGDFNGDGKADLLWQRQSDDLVEIQFLDGTNANGGGVIAGNPFSSGYALTGIGDFNGDGMSDLLYRNPSNGATGLLLLDGLSVVSSGTTAATDPLSDPVSGPGQQALALVQAIAAMPAASAATNPTANAVAGAQQSFDDHSLILSNVS